MKTGFPVIYLIVLLPLMVTSCTGKVIRGTGAEKTDQRNLNVTSVNSVDISAPVDALIYMDGQSTLTVKGPSDALPYIRTRVKGNQLIVDVPEGTDLNVSKNILVEIHIPALKSLDVSGAGKIMVESPVQADQIDLDLSGAGTIKIARLDAKTLNAELSGASDLQFNAGKVDKAKYDISGSGNINALAVEHRQAKFDISGAGEASLHVTESLEADISGAGSVRYKGRPRITQDVSGTGRLTAVD